MKKNLLMIVAIACMAFSAPVSALADGGSGQVNLQMSIDDPTSQNGGIHKAPPRAPTIFLDDHTLYFDTPCDGNTLQLLGENEEVVYAVVLPFGTTEWELPDNLFGEYKLQIIRGKYCFWGWIEL